jgi:hypothetical protein
MLLFCRARHALINRPNGIAAPASTIDPAKAPQ